MPTIAYQDLEAAAEVVYAHMSPTAQFQWPLLSQRVGTEVWVKHENHTPIGAFKVRGGLNFLTKLREMDPSCPGIITATRGNHGQSVALAAAKVGLKATILVPHGNNPEKNAAMRAFGAEVIEHGDDFQAAREYSEKLALKKELHPIPPFHPWLVAGVGTYGVEFLRDLPDLETVYVPIGMGSGICGVISARDALGLNTEVVGVVAENAPCYARSFQHQKPVATDTADTLADGLACRIPDADALKIILRGAARIITVSEEEILQAMAIYFTDTHNLAEGAGAAPLAALLREQQAMAGRKVGLVLTGGNPDRQVFAQALSRLDDQQ